MNATRRAAIVFVVLLVPAALTGAHASTGPASSAGATTCRDANVPGGTVAASTCIAGRGLAYAAHAGAYDARGTVAAGPGGAEITNVPFVADDVTIGPGGPNLGDMEIAGPTPIDSSLGNGGLTAGLTPDGTLAVLSWPNPSYFNQMDYLTFSRGDPRLGAAANQGAFAGIDYANADGSRTFSWLRDWQATQTYASGASDALVTTFERGGVTVVETALVSTSSDVLAIRYRVTGARDPKIVFFENLNPADHKLPFLPGQDQYLWMANDLAAMWHDGAVVHFREDVDPTKWLNVAEGAPGSARATIARNLAEMRRPGVFFAITSRPAPVAHQVGIDAAGLLPAYPSDAGADAWVDASAHGAALSGSDAALGQVDAAIAVPVRDGVADVVMAAAPTMDGALTLSRHTSFPGAFQAEEAYWGAWLAGAALPASSAYLDVDRRALIAIANATDRAGGSIVASIARETPYAEDWTRDGSFFNFALDLAGHPEMVEKHNLFYTRVQGANGTWQTMFYADGEVGGPFPYEADQQGLATWTLWQHYVMHPSRPYLDAVYPSIARAADWMTAYALPSGRQGPGSEDDNIFPSAGLQGAVTQWLGLESAARAALAERDPSAAARWSARAATLKASILSQYWKANGSFSPGSAGYGENFGYQGDANAAAWIIWPAGLLDPSVASERAKLSTLAAWLYDYEAARITTTSELFYDQKIIAALAVYLGAGYALPGGRDPAAVGAWSDFYHAVLPTPTLHYGEQIWQVAPGQWADRIDLPHVWSGVYVYLDQIALTRPDLMPYRPWL